MLGVSILPLSTFFLLGYVSVLSVWYFVLRYFRSDICTNMCFVRRLSLLLEVNGYLY